MNEDSKLTRTWIRVGVICGLSAVVVYPLLIFVPLPGLLEIILASAFGPLLAVASIGLYHFVALHRRSVALQVGVLFNFVAGVLNATMLIVQLSVNTTMRRYYTGAEGEANEDLLRWIWRGVDQVQLGLDVAWDVFIGMGTFLIALAMFDHPRLGKIIGIAGCVVGIACLGINFYTFPTPPANAGLIDVGPFVGSWYLVLMIMVLRSLKWADKHISLKNG